MFRSLAVAAALLLCIPALPAVASEHYSPSTLSVDVGTDVAVSFVFIHPYTAWGGSISTAGQVELDGGVNLPSGGWNIRNLMGMDFSQSRTGKVESGVFYNRFSVVHLRSPHVETRVTAGVPINFSRETTCTVQQILSRSIRGTPLYAGVRYDFQTWFGHPAKTWLGPLIELDTGHSRLSLTPQLQIGHVRAHFDLSFATFF